MLDISHSSMLQSNLSAISHLGASHRWQCTWCNYWHTVVFSYTHTFDTVFSLCCLMVSKFYIHFLLSCILWKFWKIFTVCVHNRKISEYLLLRDTTLIPNILWFEYTVTRQEARARSRKLISMKSQ